MKGETVMGHDGLLGKYPVLRLDPRFDEDIPQGLGDLMVKTNNWYPADLAKFKADPVVRTMGGSIDSRATTEQLEHIATLLPAEWLAPSASGSPEQCARLVQCQRELGADAVILHGESPEQLAPIVTAYR